MSVTSCAQIVEKGDADRFLAVMAAPVELREWLWPIYAFKVEVSRAPWVTEEPGIAEIRLQWWRDAVSEIAAGGAVRRHEVVEPLAHVVREAGLDCAALDQMVAARRWDIYNEAFEDAGHLHEYLQQTSGALMEQACISAGFYNEGLTPDVREGAADVGFAQGVANWLLAVPVLEQRGRVPLVDGTQKGLKALAAEGMQALDRARLVDFGAVTPVIRAAWRARGILRQVMRDPGAVAEARLGGSEFGRRVGLGWRAVRGTW